MPTKANDNRPQLNPQKWSQWRIGLLTTGSYDPNRWEELSPYQKDWTRDTLTAMKSFNK